jgi:hypothetical protein
VAGDFWKRQIEHSIKYAAAVKADDDERALQALIGLTRGTNEWAKILENKSRKPAVGTIAQALAAEALVGVKLISDRVLEGDQRSLQTAVDLLERNAREQARVYGAAVLDLPHTQFQKMLEELAGTTGKYVARLATGDSAGFTAATQEARLQGADLDRFTDRYLR